MTPFLPSARLSLLALVILVAAGCSKEAKLGRALERGDKHVVAGHLDLAESEFQAALRLVPKEPKAAGRLGTLYFHQGRFVPSYLLLEEAVKGDPENVAFRLTFGLLCQAVGKTVEARSAAKWVLEREPQREEALLLLAETCITTRDQVETRRMVQELREKAGAASGFHLALGALSLAQRDLAGAEKELRQALALNSRSGATQLLLGRLHGARNETAPAGEAFRAAAELSPVRSTRRLEYIEHLLATGATEEARREVDRLTQQAPDYVPGLTLAMNLAYREKRYADSGAMVEKILARDGTNHDALSQRAAVRMAQGDVDGAIGALRQMESVYAKSALVKFRMANAFLRKGEVAAAEDSLLKAIQLSPNYDEAIVLLAELNLQKGNPAAVVAPLAALIARQPRAARAYIVLAQAMQMQGRHDECLKILRAFTERAPKAPEGPYFTAMVLNHLGRKEEARAALEQSLRASENYWPAAEQLVNSDLLEGRMAPVRDYTRRLTETYSDQPVPWLLRSKVRLQDKDFAGAEADAQKAIDLAPTEPHGYLLRARALLATERPQQAVETLTALAARASNPGAYMQVGVLNGTLGQFDAARGAYEKALAIDPKFVPALNNLAALLSERFGQIEPAFRHATRARELAPNDPHVLDTLGWIMYLKGQPAEALPLLKASAERMPGERSIQFHLGSAHYRLGQEDAARPALERSLGGIPPGAHDDEARERLALLKIDADQADADVRRRLEDRYRKDPQDPVVLPRLAAIKARAGEVAEAAAMYEATIKINPRAVGVLVSLAELYAGPISKPARVRELAEMAHTAVPYDGELAWKLGRLTWSVGETVWAATAYQAAARALPEQGDLQFEAARAVYALGRVIDAEKGLQQALALPTLARHREAARRFAALLAAARSGVPDGAAVAEAKALLATERDHPAALLVTALGQEAERDHEGALRTYETLLTHHPYFAPAQRQQAYLLAEHLGDDRRAEEVALKARKALPDDGGVAYVLGAIRFRRGDYVEAVKFLTQAARGRDRHAETFFLLGMAQYQLKNSTESRTHLQRALDLKLPPQEAGEARRVLELVRNGESAR